MLFVLTPQYSSPVYNEEDIFHEYQRRSYIAALQEEQQRAAYERELAAEEQRHRIALATIAQQENARRRQSARFSPPTASVFEGARACEGGHGRRFCRQPAPEEIFARRQAREQEEERRSRLFHEHILRQVFGQAAQSAEPAQPSTSAAPAASSSAADKGKQSIRKQPLNEEQEPHWSAAPERAKSLAEIASINRTYISLVNAFTFPTGPLEPLAGSDMPRLAFNTTNASIHAFEHALSELLTKLDGIESYGFKGVREARKQLVVKIGKRLEQLEQKVAERLSQNTSPASVPVAVPEEIHVPVEEVTRQEKDTQDVEMADEPTTTVHDAVEGTTAGYDVEPEEPVEPVKDAVETADAAPSQAMDVEPVTVSEPVHSDSISRPSSPVPTPAEPVPALSPSAAEVNQSVPAPVHATTTALEESTSDEESEIEDAVHVFVDSNDEATSHDQEASDQEVEFELV